MSQLNTYKIECPKCGLDQEVDLYDAINVSLSPELKERLMTNQLNAISCDQCDFSYRVDKPLLYNDPVNHVMIYWIPDAGGADEAGQETFQTILREVNTILPEDVETPDVHLVLFRNELVERIFLLEEGLDARIIEYIKYTIYSKNLERLNPAKKNLLFNAEDSTEEKLIFVIQDVETKRLEGLIEYGRDAYEGLSEMFDRDDKTANLLELFPGPYYSARLLLLQETVDRESV